MNLLSSTTGSTNELIVSSDGKLSLNYGSYVLSTHSGCLPGIFFKSEGEGLDVKIFNSL